MSPLQGHRGELGAGEAGRGPVPALRCAEELFVRGRTRWGGHASRRVDSHEDTHAWHESCRHACVLEFASTLGRGECESLEPSCARTRFGAEEHVCGDVCSGCGHTCWRGFSHSGARAGADTDNPGEVMPGLCSRGHKVSFSTLMANDCCRLPLVTDMFWRLGEGCAPPTRSPSG